MNGTRVLTSKCHVMQFITRTFTSASSSVAINGLDSSSPEFPFPAAFTAPAETVEYEPFDGKLAARVSSLYAQLESLTTTVAQLRRDAPGKAAREYAEELGRVIEEEDKEVDGDGEEEEGEDQDVGMGDADADANANQAESQSEDAAAKTKENRQRRKQPKKESELWNLDIPLGTEKEAERWRNGEIAQVYEDALRSLLRLQGEAVPGDDEGSDPDGMDGSALASTVGKAERAGRAVDFVEKI